MNKSKLALFQSAIALLLCFSMLVGTTFAWFTDGVSSANNMIATGNLDVELEYLDENDQWTPVAEETSVLDNAALWEPGHTEVAYLRIRNAGELALKYAFGVGILKESKEQARVIRNASRYLTGEAKNSSIAYNTSDNRRTYNNSVNSTIQVAQMVIRDEQDIRSLAVEIATLTRRQQRGKGLRMA